LAYDVDIMITQLCPMDLFLQRIGRLHRHSRNRPNKLKQPLCYIIQEKEQLYDAGSAAIYGEFLLIKTDKYLKESICIPHDIPDLIQIVYDMTEADNEIIPGYKEYINVVKNKTQKAKQYCMTEIPKKGIKNLINDSVETDERNAECSVRDAGSSIEVLLMKRGEDNRAIFFDSTLENKVIHTFDIPDMNIGRYIAMQRLRLPAIFSSKYNIKKTIHELEEKNIQELSQWQKCSWINGELVLLLDENNRCELSGFKIEYDNEKGLTYELAERGDCTL